MPRLRSLKPGDYHCFLYDNQSEADAFALSFIRQGLDRNETILYFPANHRSVDLADVLKEGGVDAAGAMKAGQLRIRTSEPDTLRMLSDYLAARTDGSAEGQDVSPATGQTPVRIAIDDTERFRDRAQELSSVPPGLERPEALGDSKTLIVFMYGIDDLSPEALFRVLAIYPSLIIGDQVYENSLFRDALVSEGEILKAEDLLGLLRDHRKLKEAIKKGGEALRASEENYRSIFESAANLIATVDKNGMITDCNAKIEEVLGYSKDEVIGRSIATLFHPGHLHRIYDTLKEVIKKGASYNKQYKMLKKDGSTIYVSVNSSPLKNEKGKIAKVVSIVEDVTERRSVEEQLLQSEKRYRQLVEILPDAILTVAEDRIIFANGAAYTLLGLNHPRDLIGRRIEDLFDDEGSVILRECIATITQKGKTDGSFKVRTVRQDGSAVSIEWMGMSLDQAEGTSIMFMGRDVTDRDMADELVRESEERYRIAVEHSNDGVAIIHGDRYIYVNKRLIEIFGYANTRDLVDKSISLTIHPDDRERVLAINQMRQRGEAAPERYEFKGARKDGTNLDVEVSVAPIVYRGRTASLVYLRDLTQRKK